MNNSDPPTIVNNSVADYLARYADPFDAFNVIEKMDAGVCLLEPSTRFVYVNQKMCRSLGYETHELLGTKFTALVPSEFTATRKKHREDLDAKGRYGWMNLDVRTSCGDEVPVQFYGHYVDVNGERLILSMMVRAGGPKCAELETDDDAFWKNFHATMFRELDFDPTWLMNNLPIGVGVATPDGTIRYVNSTYANWLGLESGDLVGKPNLNFLSDSMGESPEILGKFMSCLTFGSYDWFEMDVKHVDGGHVVIRTRATLEKIKGKNCIVGLFENMGRKENPP